MGKYCGSEKTLSPPWFRHCGAPAVPTPLVCNNSSAANNNYNRQTDARCLYSSRPGVFTPPPGHDPLGAVAGWGVRCDLDRDRRVCSLIKGRYSYSQSRTLPHISSYGSGTTVTLASRPATSENHMARTRRNCSIILILCSIIY